MAPKGRVVVRRSPRNSTRPASASAATKPARRTGLGGKTKDREVLVDSAPAPCSPSTSYADNTGLPEGTGSCCSTPKARRFQIPPIDTCPPAPKKQRAASKNCSLQRRPIAFFAHPDIEIFFNFAFRGISV